MTNSPTAPAADPAGEAARRLDGLAEAYHGHQMAADPLLATYHGLPEHRDRLPDRSLDGLQAVRDRAADLRRRVAEVDADVLDDTRRTSRHMLLELLGYDLEWIDGLWDELSVDAFALGPVAQLMFFLPRTDIADLEQARAHVRRLGAVAGFLDDAIAGHRRGVEAGLTPSVRGVQAAAAAARRLAAEPDGLLRPFRAFPGEVADQAARAVERVVVPALHAHADALDTDILPHARPDDRAGLCWLPDGQARYRQMLRRYTTLADPDPDEIHQRGLDVVAALEGEYAAVGRSALGLTDLAAIAERLRHDPDLQYGSPAEIVPHAEAVVARAAKAVQTVIGRLPSTPCRVQAFPEVEAPGQGAAMYQPPAEGRPHGTYWVNTTEPVLRRFEAEVTAFHEASPGHHTQVGLQMELDLPAFRRMGWVLSGYSEGWGLYTERLADELGLYSSDVDRLGMLAMDSARACRLVIDTGLHHRGWSRQQAIEYFSANSPLDEDLVTSEVDRYIVFPGQACSYMLGRHEIQRLRADAHARLGEAFDLKAFHDVVLGQGAVPLSVLARMINEWVAAEVAVADR